MTLIVTIHELFLDVAQRSGCLSRTTAKVDPRDYKLHGKQNRLASSKPMLRTCLSLYTQIYNRTYITGSILRCLAIVSGTQTRRFSTGLGTRD